MALCAIGMSACQDDLIENVSTGGADASKPVKVDLKFGIPKSMEVEVTRADNSRSEMYGARLYVFSGDRLLGRSTMLPPLGTQRPGPRNGAARARSTEERAHRHPGAADAGPGGLPHHATAARLDPLAI